jgi:cystathionine beta-lyase
LENIFDIEIDRRGTSCIKWDSYPPEKIPLFIADMDFRSPQPVIDALQKRISHGIFGYTRPDDEIYKTLKDHFSREYNTHVDNSWIVWLPGIVPALIASCRDSAGEVLVNTPNYPFLLSAPSKAGVRRCQWRELPE